MRNESALEQLFVEQGEHKEASGNRPVLVTDEQHVWYVLGGRVDVFSALLEDGDVADQKRFLFGLGEGRILFGYDGDSSRGLLVSGLSDARLIRLDKSRLQAEASDPEVARMIVQSMEDWIRDWMSALGEMKIESGVNDEQAAGLNLAGQYDMDAHWERLTGFHRFVSIRLIRFHTMNLENETMRLKRKSENDRQIMEQALKRLVSVSAKPSRHSVADMTSNDPLWNVCRMVGDASGISLSAASNKAALASRDPIQDIAVQSGIRSRQVMLKDDWWEEDNGPLVAFMEEGNKPIALIPATPTNYEMIDPVDRSRRIVTREIAQTIAPIAHMFYRPFPSRSLTIMDIIKAGNYRFLRRDVTMMLLMGVVGGLLGMFIPIANGILFDTIIPGSDRGSLMQMAFILLSVTGAMFLFGLVRAMAMLRTEGKMDSQIQAAVWDRLLNLPVSFFRNYTAGDLAVRANSIGAIRQMLSGVAVSAIFSGIFSSFNIILLFYYDVKLALVAATLVLVSILVTVGVGLLQVRRQRILLRMQGAISGTVLQFINGIAKFRMAAAERRAFNLWAHLFGEMKEASFKSRSLANIHAVFNVVFPTATSMVLFYLVVNGSGITSAGQFIAFFAAFSTFLSAMIAMSTAFVTIVNIIPQYERAKPILQAIPEVHESLEDPGELAGEIEVKHVRFRYSAEQPHVLNDLSLHIRQGEFVALVGASGCGKSTLFRMLVGFEKPESGSIFYDGQDVRTLDIRSVRAQLGVVLQNGKIMAGDLFTNIVGSSLLTMDDAWEAARMAGFDNDIRQMPMGMHTVLSEGGGALSGGQRQRLLIARAMARKPKVILFDEATSALDNRTQAIVSESLETMSATRVVIAHRLSTIMNADRIFVLDKGKVVQVGTYAELINQEGLFLELARRQLA